MDEIAAALQTMRGKLDGQARLRHDAARTNLERHGEQLAAVEAKLDQVLSLLSGPGGGDKSQRE